MSRRSPRKKRAMVMATMTAARPKMKAPASTANQVRAATIPSAAPKEAPARTPSNPGETRGLMNMD